MPRLKRSWSPGLKVVALTEARVFHGLAWDPVPLVAAEQSTYVLAAAMGGVGLAGGVGFVSVGRLEAIWLVLQAVRQRQAARQIDSAGALFGRNCMREGCLAWIELRETIPAAPEETARVLRRGWRVTRRVSRPDRVSGLWASV
jgi:hypothetical protein